VGSSGCSRDAEPTPEQKAEQAALASSEAALIAAQALFDAGQLDEALALLDVADQRHAAGREQIEQELSRRAAIDKFEAWSVGPARMNRSPNQIRNLCKRRGGTWIVAEGGLRICSEAGKLAVIRVVNGSAVHLTGMYTADYVTSKNPNLYENELRVLRESFGEPQSVANEPTVPLEWNMPRDARIRLSRTNDGDVFLVVGLASAFSDDPDAFVLAVDRALRQQAAADDRHKAAQRRERGMLSQIHGSGWSCGSLAFRLMPGGRARIALRGNHGPQYYTGSYEADERGSELELNFTHQGMFAGQLFVREVRRDRIVFSQSPGSRITSWCTMTDRI
jgi:hypothetical protein